MISISIIGSGNVAHHLIQAILKSDQLRLVQVFARAKESVAHWVPADVIISEISEMQPADLYIVSVSDDAIPQVSNSLPFKDQLVAHTSGSVALNDLNDSNRKAVLYPLQTLSKNKEIDFTKVPLCIEAEQETDLQLLKEVAKNLSGQVYEIDSIQRKSLHVAAVFVSNFANHMYAIGNDICTEHQIPFDILKPLIAETAEKIHSLTPSEAQTGPAKRNDTTTINKHLAILSDSNQREIYRLLTKSIIDHGKKL